MPEFLESPVDEAEHWRQRGDEALAQLEAAWRAGGSVGDELRYLRARALALEALVAQKVSPPEFF